MHCERVACTEAGPPRPHFGHAVQRIGRCSVAPRPPPSPAPLTKCMVGKHGGARTRFIMLIFSCSDPTQERSSHPRKSRGAFCSLSSLFCLLAGSFQR